MSKQKIERVKTKSKLMVFKENDPNIFDVIYAGENEKYRPSYTRQIGIAIDPVNYWFDVLMKEVREKAIEHERRIKNDPQADKLEKEHNDALSRVEFGFPGDEFDAL
jgi:hypothetical protein